MNYLTYRARIYPAMNAADASPVCAEISLDPSSLGQQLENSIAITIPEIKAALWQELYLHAINSDVVFIYSKVIVELSLGSDRVSYELLISKDEPNPTRKLLAELIRFEILLRAWLYSCTVHATAFKEMDIAVNAGCEREARL